MRPHLGKHESQEHCDTLEVVHNEQDKRRRLVSSLHAPSRLLFFKITPSPRGGVGMAKIFSNPAVCFALSTFRQRPLPNREDLHRRSHPRLPYHPYHHLPLHPCLSSS